MKKTQIVRMPLLPLCDGLEHRGGFSPEAMFLPAGAYDDFGGRDAIHRLVDALYDRFEADPILRPLFARDLTEERAKVKLFFEGWFGGSPDYFNADWRHGLRPAHRHISISRGYAGRWIGHFLSACAEACADPDVVRSLKAPIARLAMALVNRADEPQPGERLRGDICAREIKPFFPLILSDNASGVAAADAGEPSVLARHGASLLLLAAIRGKANAVQALLEAGVDVNAPAALPGNEAKSQGFPQLEITPLCGALVKRRHGIVAMLMAYGARYDIFTAASTGDISAVTRLLDKAPHLANTHDPACDLARISPLDHAVQFRQFATAQVLLEHGALVGPHSARLVAAAANVGDEPLVELLLAHGASAAIGAGRWVLYPSIAAQLLARGADVNRNPGQWIGMCCTGNSGHKENIALASAFLMYGADVTARYKGRTALHCAAKAGFVTVGQALIDHGADVNALSDDGITSLDDVENAARTIERRPMRQLLSTHGAVRSGSKPVPAKP